MWDNHHICRLSLALAGHRDGHSFQLSCSVPGRRCLNTCKTVFKREGELQVCNMGLFWKRWYLLGAPANGFNLYPGPGCSLSARRCPGVLMVLIQFAPSQVIPPGQIHRVRPLFPPRVLPRDWAVRRMAVPWCAEISSFLCRSLGRVKKSSIHFCSARAVHVDQEDWQVREEICRKWQHLLCKKNPAKLHYTGNVYEQHRNMLQHLNYWIIKMLQHISVLHIYAESTAEQCDHQATLGVNQNWIIYLLVFRLHFL